jgi:hypothetical protein
MPKESRKPRPVKLPASSPYQRDDSPAASVATRIASTHSLADINMQRDDRGWKQHPSDPSGNSYYWANRTKAVGVPPNNGTIIPRPTLSQGNDNHSARRSGSMKSLRTVADHPNQNMDTLVHLSHQELAQKGLFYPYPLEQRGLGTQSVQTSIPHRDPNAHRNIFSKMTGGESSSTKYQQSLGTALPNTSYQILHLMGHGEGGQKTQSANNLVSASEGANSEMIPFDKAFSGDSDMENNTTGHVRPGTHRAEYINMSYAHRSFAETPIFTRKIDGDTPKQTRSQYEQLEAEASEYVGDKDHRFSAAALFHMSKQ